MPSLDRRRRALKQNAPVISAPVQNSPEPFRQFGFPGAAHVGIEEGLRFFRGDCCKLIPTFFSFKRVRPPILVQTIDSLHKAGPSSR